MKSLIKKNIHIYLSKGYYIVYIIFPLIYGLFYKSSGVIYTITASSIFNQYFFANGLVLIINFTYILYVTDVYINDVKRNSESIFLRISYPNWILSIIISFCLTTIISLLLTIIIALILKIEIIGSLYLYLGLFLSKIIIQLIHLLFLQISDKAASIISGLIILYPLILSKKSIIYISDVYQNGIPILIILTVVITLLIFKFKNKNIFITRRKYGNKY